MQKSPYLEDPAFRNLAESVGQLAVSLVNNERDMRGLDLVEDDRFVVIQTDLFPNYQGAADFLVQFSRAAFPEGPSAYDLQQAEIMLDGLNDVTSNKGMQTMLFELDRSFV